MNASVSERSWQVPLDHPAFAGHFPGMPIFPGVLLLDVVMQILATSGIITDRVEWRTAKFLSPACPGENLTIEHTASSGGMIHIEIFAGARRIAVGDLAASAPEQTA